MNQAFDQVWNAELLHKISQAQILSQYLRDRSFQMHYEEATSVLKTIEAGATPGSVLNPHLYLLCTADVPRLANTTISTFADDAAIVSSHHKYDLVGWNDEELKSM